ncbi:hypothetical protein BT69DRAFT_1297265 [Atractiella rhizophila]|nr:hypothetical protein BT69DRAFT_1297265 [Atractiella rhizophila]
MELLKVVGAFPEKEKESAPWQEEVTLKIKTGGGELPFDDDTDIVVQVGIVKDTIAKMTLSTYDVLLQSTDYSWTLQLCSIIKHMHLTPQRRKSWFKILEETLAEFGKLFDEKLKILVLDCQTDWSSTHNKLSLCLWYREAIGKSQRVVG